MTDDIQLGKRIRDIRVQKGLSQGDLAKAIGLESHAAVSDIERGKTNIKVSHLKSIAQFFNMTPEDLLNSQVITAQTTQYRTSKDITKDEADDAQDMDGFWKRVEEYKKR